MPATVNPALLQIGPGILYVAPISTAEPTSITAAWPSGWLALGSTETGSEFIYNITVADIDVAEQLDPVKVATTKRKGDLKFDLAEFSAFHMQLALNGGATPPTVNGAGVVVPTIPTIGQEVRVMIGWDSDDSQERWIWRRCLQAGSLGIKRQKAPAKSLITCDFQLEVPVPVAGDGLLFKPMFATARTS
jgi:hypothetical protein